MVSPCSASIAAGASQVYSAEAFDQYGKSLGSVPAVFSAVGASVVGNSVSASVVGYYMVTGAYMGKSAVASLTVTPAVVVSAVAISSVGSSVVAGLSKVYSATASDVFGNTWDVTSLTSWSVSSGAGGSWSGNVYTSAKAGSWTVTGTYMGKSAVASLTVTPAAVVSAVAISSVGSSVVAGLSKVYSATASDVFGNTWDVTSLTSWSVSSGAGGSWSGNVYTSAKAGSWTVTGTYMGKSAVASLTVTPAVVVSAVAISSVGSSVVAGLSKVYSATASDVFGNTWDVTSLTSWSVSSGAGGSWSGNVYTSAKAGSWTVTGTYMGKSAVASLTVTPAVVVSAVAISSVGSSVVAGLSKVYSATASDVFGNTWDVTSLTSWSVSSGAGGSWSGNVYTSAKAGSWTVTGTYMGKSAVASLTVTPAVVVSAVAISSVGSSVVAGLSKVYSATASDVFGNTWDVTSLTSWSVSSGAGGSWSGNVYTSAKAGSWTVTGTYASTAYTAGLTVTPAAVAYLVVSSGISQVAGKVFYLTVTAKMRVGMWLRIMLVRFILVLRILGLVLVCQVTILSSLMIRVLRVSWLCW